MYGILDSLQHAKRAIICVRCDCSQMTSPTNKTSMIKLEILVQMVQSCICNKNPEHDQPNDLKRMIDSKSISETSKERKEKEAPLISELWERHQPSVYSGTDQSSRKKWERSDVRAVQSTINVISPWLFSPHIPGNIFIVFRINRDLNSSLLQ